MSTNKIILIAAPASVSIFIGLVQKFIPRIVNGLGLFALRIDDHYRWSLLFSLSSIPIGQVFTIRITTFNEIGKKLLHRFRSLVIVSRPCIIVHKVKVSHSILDFCSMWRSNGLWHLNCIRPFFSGASCQSRNQVIVSERWSYLTVKVSMNRLFTMVSM